MLNKYRILINYCKSGSPNLTLYNIVLLFSELSNQLVLWIEWITMKNWIYHESKGKSLLENKGENGELRTTELTATFFFFFECESDVWVMVSCEKRGGEKREVLSEREKKKKPITHFVIVDLSYYKSRRINIFHYILSTFVFVVFWPNWF